MIPNLPPPLAEIKRKEKRDTLSHKCTVGVSLKAIKRQRLEATGHENSTHSLAHEHTIRRVLEHREKVTGLQLVKTHAVYLKNKLKNRPL